jgi:acyl carrier protein
MNRQEIFAVIKGNVEQIIEGARGRPIEEVHSMRDFGADSLEIVEVVGRSMKQLKIKVPRTELSGARNLGDLVTLFEKAGADARVS